MNDLEQFLNSGLEQFLAELDIPTNIADAMTKHADGEECEHLWQELTEALEEIFDVASTADGAVALGMLNATAAVRLAKQIKVGTGEDMKNAEQVDAKFCIVALLILSLRALKQTSVKETLH